MFCPKVFNYAIAVAQDAPKNEIPVAAVISKDNKIIATATNNTFATKRDWYHAEYIAICKAIHKLSRVRYLDEFSIYVTLEPCLFCTAFLEKVRIGHIYFGAYNFDKPALTECISKFRYLLNNTEIIGGIYEQTCHNMLVDFFKTVRTHETK